MKYEPFGKEWEDYLMKLPKKHIIDLYRRVCLEKKDGESRSVEKLVMPKIADGCTCQSCGRKYKVDFLLPDDLWLKISPKKSEAGLLCGGCIANAIENLNEFNAFMVKKC